MEIMILNAKIKDLTFEQQVIYAMLDEIAVKCDFESLNEYLDNFKKWDNTVYDILNDLMRC